MSLTGASFTQLTVTIDMSSVALYRPLNFGSTERQLFGMFYPTSVPASELRSAVLICNPFGQEAIRAHRFLRTLAERLARVGHPVLRFDYFGTGDSMGDDLDCSLSGCSKDILIAHDELLRLSKSSNVVWVGMRLGGTIALQTAHSASIGLSKLIAWDPILDGKAYLGHLRERHIEGLEHEYSLPLKPSPRELAKDSSYLCDEAIGFALSSDFRKEITSVRLEAFAWPPRPASISILTDPETQDGKLLKQLLDREPSTVMTYTVKHGIDWTSDTALNTSLVPTVALMTIVQQAGETA